jgi:hypothetical protein
MFDYNKKTTMKTGLLYVHGLNSSSKSSKFQTFSKYFDSSICVEWKNGVTTIETILSDMDTGHKKLGEECAEVVIIGDSTGANWVLQYQALSKRSYAVSSYALISPLLTKDSVNEPGIFEVKTWGQLQDFEKIKDLVVLYAVNDQVLNIVPHKGWQCEIHAYEGGTHKAPTDLDTMADEILGHMETYACNR